MLVVAIVFIAATIAVPALQSILAQGAKQLPFGLNHVRGLVYTLTLVAGLVLVFAILCLIYWAVPNGPMPWRAIWPGASLATLAIGIVDYAFPFYLSGSRASPSWARVSCSSSSCCCGSTPSRSSCSGAPR